MQTSVEICVDFEVAHLSIHPHGLEIAVQENPHIKEEDWCARLCCTSMTSEMLPLLIVV